MKNNKIIISLIRLISLVVLAGTMWYLVTSRDLNTQTKSNLTGLAATVYYQEDCLCCIEYIKYLKNNGLQVKKVILSLEDLGNLKNNLNIPRSSFACHTSKIGDYFVEGHVPVEAIEKLLTEKPAIDGIALPGMPMGSPGMTGFKTGPLKIQAISDGNITGLFAEE